MKNVSSQLPLLINGEQAVDDRGGLKFVNAFDFRDAGVKRFYQVQNHQAGFIRAWHGHRRESKFVFVPQGAALVCATIIDPPDPYPELPGSLPTQMYRFTLSSARPAILYIPGGFFNGFKTLTDDAILMFFSTATLDESRQDDIRVDWDKFGKGVWEVNYR